MNTNELLIGMTVWVGGYTDGYINQMIVRGVSGDGLDVYVENETGSLDMRIPVTNVHRSFRDALEASIALATVNLESITAVLAKLRAELDKEQR